MGSGDGVREKTNETSWNNCLWAYNRTFSENLIIYKLAVLFATVNVCQRMLGMSSPCLPRITCDRCIVIFRKYKIQNSKCLYILQCCFSGISLEGKYVILNAQHGWAHSVNRNYFYAKLGARRAHCTQTVNYTIESYMKTTSMCFHFTSLPCFK